MANIDTLTFSITRTSFPAGHICSVDYSYYLNIDKEEYQQDLSYSVSAVLFGDDLLQSKVLDEPHDMHVLTKINKMPIERHFALSCETLNEALGEDKIFLKIFITSSNGDVISEQSETIHDWF